MAELQKIHFVLSRIRTDEFAVTEEKYVLSVEAEMNFNLGFTCSAAEKSVTLQVKCLFYQRNKLLFVIAVSCMFVMNAEEWQQLRNAEDKTLTLPKPLARHMADITISTARGVLHAKTESFPINEIILPPVNLNEMIPGEVIMEL
jgi:hypothetical protein